MRWSILEETISVTIDSLLGFWDFVPSPAKGLRPLKSYLLFRSFILKKIG